MDFMGFLIVIILVIIFVVIIWWPWPTQQNIYKVTPVATNTGTDMQMEQMAPLSVFGGQRGCYYALETPRKYMSHDLRGDPFRIPKRQFVWNYSTIPEYEAAPVCY